MEKIINFIEENYEKIINNLDIESIEVYCFLQEQFAKSNVETNYLFQFVFRNFYGFRNARVSDEFKKSFFHLLQENRNNEEYEKEECLKKLYKIKDIFYFSFYTKLLHTIDNNKPIYDSEVCLMFGFKRPTIKDFDGKKKVSTIQYNKIESAYNQIISEKLIPKTMILFDKKFGEYNLSEIKKLDFIFWSAGKVKKKLNWGSEFDFWNVPLLNNKKIHEIDDLNFQIAANWVYNKIKDLPSPQKWIKDRKQSVLEDEKEELRNLLIEENFSDTELNHEIYVLECNIRSIFIDCKNYIYTNNP